MYAELDAFLAVPNGTIWTNEFPESVDLSTAGGWTNAALVAGSTTTIDQFTAYGFKASGTGSMVHSVVKTLGGVGNAPLTNADLVYFSAYVKKGAVDWVFIRLTATTAAFGAVGADQYFDLATPALGSAVAVSTGSVSAAGIVEVTGGYKIWAVVDCGVDNTNGFSASVGPADSDTGKTYAAADATSIQFYASGAVLVDGAAGELPYIAP